MDTNGEQQNHSLHCGSDTFFHRLKYLMCCFEAGGQRTISKYFLWNNHTGRKWGLWWKYSYFWLSLTHSALKNHWLHQWYTLGKTIPSFSNSFATIMPCSLVQVEGGRVNWCNAGLTVVTQDKEAAIWNIISMFKLWLKYMYTWVWTESFRNYPHGEFSSPAQTSQRNFSESLPTSDTFGKTFHQQMRIFNLLRSRNNVDRKVLEAKSPDISNHRTKWLTVDMLSAVPPLVLALHLPKMCCTDIFSCLASSW